MNRTRPLNVLVSFGLTFLILLGSYMLFALTLYPLGFDELISFLIFQPIYGTILALLTLIVCFILGLPIRFVKPIRQWWGKQYKLAVGGVIVGLALLGISFLPGLGHTAITSLENGERRSEYVPDLTVLGIGWLALSFFLLHGQLTDRWTSFWRSIRD